MIRRVSFRLIFQMKYIHNAHRRLYFVALLSLGCPSTDREVTQYVGLSDPNYFRPRRHELMRDGFIVKCGKRKCKVSGKTALTWWFA